MPGERRQHQTAYQILVASSWELLDKDEGDLWDSEQVESDQSNLIVYQGSPAGLAADLEREWKDIEEDLGPFRYYSVL